MKNEIKELKAELLKVFSKFEENECEAKTVLTDGDEEGWYVSGSDIALHKHGQVWCLGVFGDGRLYTETLYTETRWLYNGCNGTWRKATNSEVIEAFTNHFRSQGWVSGKTKFRGALGAEHTYREPLKLSMFGHIYVESCGTLFNSDILALATKIEDEKIMVDGKEVKILDKRTFKIGDYYFSKDAALELRTLNPIFQKILDKLNEK